MTPAEVVQQLFQCCDDDLGNAVLKTSPAAVEGTEDVLLAAIKQLAVVPVAISVRRTDFLSTHQDPGQSVRDFYADLKGKSETCPYSKKCSLTACTQVNDFTDIIVKDVLVAGLVDEDIKKDVLGWSELDTKDVNETVAFIESKEMARDALKQNKPINAALSQYKKSKTLSATAPPATSKGSCKTCKVDIDKLVWSKRQKKFVETSMCLPCWQKANPRRVKNSRPATDVKDDETAALLVGALSTTTIHDDSPSEDAPSTFIGAISDVPTNEYSHTTPSATGRVPTLPLRMHVVLTFIVALLSQAASSFLYLRGYIARFLQVVLLLAMLALQTVCILRSVSHIMTVTSSLNDSPTSRSVSNDLTVAAQEITLDHHIFESNEGWRRAESMSHPTLRLRITAHDQDYEHFGGSCPQVGPSWVTAVTDTGAQSCLWSLSQFYKCGFTDRDLLPVRRSMVAANSEEIKIVGAVFIRLSGTD